MVARAPTAYIFLSWAKPSVGSFAVLLPRGGTHWRQATFDLLGIFQDFLMIGRRYTMKLLPNNSPGQTAGGALVRMPGLVTTPFDSADAGTGLSFSKAGFLA